MPPLAPVISTRCIPSSCARRSLCRAAGHATPNGASQPPHRVIHPLSSGFAQDSTLRADDTGPRLDPNIDALCSSDPFAFLALVPRLSERSNLAKVRTKRRWRSNGEHGGRSVRISLTMLCEKPTTTLQHERLGVIAAGPLLVASR